MKLSDYIAERLVQTGITVNFSVTGGGAMHLNDSLGQHPSITSIYNHHEQASAMAAEGYARITGKPAVVCVTTGPGAINSLNGVFGAYTDSMPMVVLAGQVKVQTMSATYPHLKNLRQLGDQEARSIEYVKTLCKASFLIKDVEHAAEQIDLALTLCIDGRPGPVWIEVPVDIQAADISADPKRPFQMAAKTRVTANEDLEYVAKRLLSARRPVVIAGSGVRIANQISHLEKLAEKFSVPVATAWSHDVFNNDHPLFAGRPGTIGTRPGNFVVQNSDLVLVLGSRLNIRQISYAWDSFAKNAEILWVDVDANEFEKPFPKADRVIEADLAEFVPALLKIEGHETLNSKRQAWINWVSNIKNKYSPKPIDYVSAKPLINPYSLIFKLFDLLPLNSQVASANASACILPFQVAHLKPGMRLFSNSGSASMGYELPAALGAAIANPDNRTIAIAGDGSIMMNIQELDTIKRLNLDIGILVIANDGYLSIKQTQSNFFNRASGSSPESGVSLPDLRQIGQAFGINSTEVSDEKLLDGVLAEFLNETGPRMLVVQVDPSQEFSPRLKSRLENGIISTPDLDDMYPFLPRTELNLVRDTAGNL
jgi:acetolactate synthase-1/2/3 large subunit